MDTKNPIDPTVPHQGLPESWIKTAEWAFEEEVITANGLERRIPRKYVKINGIIFNENTSIGVWREVLKHYPKVPVIIPENDDERERRMKSGKYRAAEQIVWNGVEFAMPKGIPVMVPEPIADMVAHLNEVYRSKEIQDLVNELVEKGSTITG